MFTRGKRILFVAVIGVSMFSWAPVSASEIVNGSFETGDYTGWTLLKKGKRATDGVWAVMQNGESVEYGQAIWDYAGGLLVRQYATFLPRAFNSSEGAIAAVQLQNSPVIARMSQDVTLPGNTTAISWDMAYTNYAGSFQSNQYLAVHIRDLNDVILHTAFITGPDSPQSVPMSTHAVDVASFAGQTVRLDVEVNVGINLFPVELDNFRIETAPVPTIPVATLPPGWGMGEKTGWQGPLPPGLEQQDKIPPGFEKGQKNGFQR